jgi:hypothetical protein
LNLSFKLFNFDFYHQFDRKADCWFKLKQREGERRCRRRMEERTRKNKKKTWAIILEV